MVKVMDSHASQTCLVHTVPVINNNNKTNNNRLIFDLPWDYIYQGSIKIYNNTEDNVYGHCEISPSSRDE